MYSEMKNSASTCISGFWPPHEPAEAFINSVYNCLVYELSDKTFVVVCVDTIDVFGDGQSEADAIKDFRMGVEKCIHEKRGGIFVATSSFTFQEFMSRDLERDWQDDGISVVNRSRICIQLFMNGIGNLDA